MLKKTERKLNEILNYDDICFNEIFNPVKQTVLIL